MRPSLKAWLDMKGPGEGGRSGLFTADFCPDLRIAGAGRLIPVRVREVCVSPRPGSVSPGDSAVVRLEFVYPDFAENGWLIEGTSFEVLEGPKVIGAGEVMRIDPATTHA